LFFVGTANPYILTTSIRKSGESMSTDKEWDQEDQEYNVTGATRIGEVHYIDKRSIPQQL
jgi:hypothetical protein